jgi:hypothetical protein
MCLHYKAQIVRLKAGCRVSVTRQGEWIFFNVHISSGRIRLWGLFSLCETGVPESENKVILGSIGRSAREDDKPITGRPSRQCEILNISQPYRPPQPVTEIDLLLHMHMFVPHRKHSYGPPWPVTVDKVRTPQETYLWSYTACNEDSFTFLYIDYVHKSQETLVCASTAC